MTIETECGVSQSSQGHLHYQSVHYPCLVINQHAHGIGVQIQKSINVGEKTHFK